MNTKLICDEFALHLRKQERSENTVSSYLRDVKQFISWYQEKNCESLDKVIDLDVIEYKKHLTNSSYKVATVNRKLASINTFMEFLKYSGVISNVIEIKLIKDKDSKEFKGLSDSDLWKLRKEIHRNGTARDIAIFEMLIGTGIRVSELVDIRLSDIEISERKGSLVIRQGKGNAKRTVSLNKDVRAAIEKYLETRQSDNEFLFLGQRGAMSRKGVDIVLKKHGKRVDVDVSSHMLRHTLAYKLVSNKDVAITTVQKILGHNDLATTMIYTQTTEEDKEKALDSIEW